MNCNALEIKQLSKTYKNGFKALDDVSLEIKPGDFFSLLGPNGAGKTTLIGIISTLVKKSSGQVSIGGHDLETDEMAAKRLLGVVPQEVNLASFETCWQILINQAGYYGISGKLAKIRAEKYLKQLFLWDKRDQQTIALSGGMKRRLMIARALIHEPRLLLLDEPTAGVDIEIRHSMWEFLKETNRHGTSILLTTHYLEEAENLCNRVALINHGRVQSSGSMSEFLDQLEAEPMTLHLTQALQEAPALEGWQWQLSTPTTLEINLPKEKTISELITVLENKSIHVNRITHKTSRLEELFINLTRQTDS